MNLSKLRHIAFVFALLIANTLMAKDVAVATASFSVSGTQCQNVAVDFIDGSSTTVGSIILWAWDFGDGSSSNVQNPSHVYSSSGDFTVRLTVIDSNGDVDEHTAVVTVEPAATVDFSVTSSDNCISTGQTFTSSVSISSGSVTTYRWDYGDGSISTGVNGSHTYSLPGTYDVTFTATSALGCPSAITKEVTIFEDPNAGFSFSNECLGNEVSFINTSSIGNGNLSYSWNFGDTETSTQANPTHTYVSAGDYSVSLTVTSSNGGCTAISNQTVTVYENPVSNFSFTPQCFGDNVDFTNNSTGSNLTYEWDFGDGNSSTTLEPSHLYDLAGSYIVTLTVTSDDNCTNSSSQRVDIYNNPLPTFFASDNCQENTVSFSNLTNENGDTYTYSWDFGDTNSSTDENPTHNYASSGTYTVMLTATTSDGCQATYSEDVVIWDHPAAGFTFSNGCDGVVNTFTNTSTIASGSITSYVWDYGDGSVSTGATGSHTYVLPGTYDVTLTAVSENGCEDELTQQITIFAKPVTAFSYSGACDGNVISFTNESTVSAGNLNYIWDFGDGGSSNLANPVHTYATQGTYTVSLEARNNVGGCFTVYSQDIEIFQELTSSFTFTPQCFGDAVVFDNTSIGTGVTFAWNFGDGNTSTFFEPSHTYESPGSYIVSLQVTSSDGCVRNSESRVDIYENPLPTFFALDNCQENTVSFSNLTNENGDIYTYSWDFGDTNSSTDKNPTHDYASSGTYTVVLTATTSDGCQASYSEDVEIWDHPVAGFTFSDGCDGVGNTFTNTSTIASGSIASYVWDYGDGSVSSGATGSHIYVLPGTYDVTLTAVSENGCEDELTQQITIFAKPVTAFSYSGACDGNVISFTNESTVSAGNLNYTWDFGDGGSSNLANPVHAYATQGTYTVSLEARNNVGGCFTVYSQDIEIFQELTSSFTFTPQCFGDAVVFDNTSIGTGVTYAWNFGDGNTSTFFEPSHTYESPGSYIVSLQVTSSDGCVRESESRVDIYENPQPVFFAENSCELDEILFTNLTDGNNVASYLWNFGDGTSSIEREPTHAYSTAGFYTVSLTVTTNDACQSTVSSDVEIYETPVADFNIPAVCDGFVSQFENLSSGSIESYVWDFGDLTNSTQENPDKQYLNAGTYNVTLTVESTNGCVHSITKEAVVEEVPLANFNATDECLGVPTQFTNTSIDNSTTTTFFWDFGDGSTSVVESPSHTYSNPGLYTVELLISSSAGCEDRINKQVIVYDLPEVDAGRDTAISRGHSVQLQARGGVNYQWGPIAGLNNSTISNPVARPLETTEYTVTVTDQFGCQNTDSIIVTINEDFRVVANNIFTPDGNGQNDQWVVPNADAFERVEVKVYDRYGVLVFEDLDYQNDWEGTRGADILPDGTYYYLITFPGTEVNYSGAITILRNN